MNTLSILLSRAQMGLTLTMHIIFPALNIGLALFLCVMEGLWLKTRNPIYLKICKFWIKVFALAFGMGVVTGIVMAFELGANFGGFTEAIGEILGSLFVYEVLTAFFLEAGFLGIMLFGWNRVTPRMHFFATLMVTFGTFLSAFWIMSANSWMQTPAGYQLVDGVFKVDSWMAAIFNPSVLHRFLHMVFASYLSAAFFVIGISAWFLLKGRHLEMNKKVFSLVLWAALLMVPVQLWLGDEVGLIVQKYQPIKTAAMEAVWDTQAGAPFVVIAWPSEKLEKNLYALTIPKLASILNTHDPDGVLVGVTSVPKEDRPNVPIPFFTFRIMVGIGLLFFLIALLPLWLRRKNKLYTSRWFLWLCLLATPLGFIATIAGWFTAEIGRQPWVVYGLMKTSKGASDLAAEHVAVTISAFFLIYLFIFSYFIYYLCNTIRKGPQDLTPQQEENEPHSTIGYMDPGAHLE